ncbi:hypothetical protein O0550_13600 [Brevibacillus halotolerans]|uniref:hypothetical protein n=1 Tax=Brevibacillus TaxID=55080 RepID=UPI00215BC562|nr:MULTISPECIES: hypothetical protein [Brevibacillus]MCR8964228.1 hypothetical protein [Brevibacillus laterosporus]MCZ0836383.1 hypothetical protein [Brevibacillus halotolerans]
MIKNFEEHTMATIGQCHTTRRKKYGKDKHKKRGLLAMEDILDQVARLGKQLHQKDITFALGGSTLLYSLGLETTFRDIDITTDASVDKLSEALTEYPVTVEISGDGIYNTQYRLSVELHGKEIDFMGNFSVKTKTGVCHLPCLPAYEWRGIPVCAPEVWAVAYHLIDRSQKADRIYGYLEKNGTNLDVCKRLLQEPLPEEVKIRLLSLIQLYS